MEYVRKVFRRVKNRIVNRPSAVQKRYYLKLRAQLDPLRRPSDSGPNRPVLMISGMITGGILGRYEAAFSVMPLLVTFIPMLTDTGGNAGSQSSTLVIRGMAVGDIALSDFPKVLWKELRVSLLVGAVLSLVNLVRLLLSYPGNELVCVTVTLSLFATVVLAKTIGGALPMLAKLVRADPAIMAAPLITTIVDALSLVLYFTIASRLLHL